MIMRKYDSATSYLDLIAMNSGRQVFVEESTPDDKGDSYIIVRDGDRFGFLVFGWGSCPGCDAFEGAREEANAEAALTELRESLVGSIVWKDNAEDMLAYLNEKDFEIERLGYDDELVARFKSAATSALQSAIAARHPAP